MLDEEKGQTQLPCKQKPLPDRDVVISEGATGANAPIDFKKSLFALASCDQGQGKSFSRSLSMDFMKRKRDICTHGFKSVTTSLLEK